MVLEFPGFAYDQAGAEALARILRPAVEAAAGDEGRVPTVLAGLALTAAAVIQRSGLRRNPSPAAAAVRDLLLQALAAEVLPW